VTQLVETKPEFQSLTEGAVLAAIAGTHPKNPVAVEVARLTAAYKEEFRFQVKRLGYLPPDILPVKARWPIEAVAIRLATENIRKAILQAPENDTAECVERLRAVVEKLATEGVDTIFIIAALAEVAVMTARRDPEHAVAHLEGASAALTAAAQGLRARKSS
jgi:hypothetical protein